jgi:hypothetical protein
MRNHIRYLIVGLAFTALGVACGGRTSEVKQTEERTTSAVNRNDLDRVSLIGCVKPAPKVGEGQFILANVLPRGEGIADNPRIPRGSWVRLEGPELNRYAGKEVVISGWIVDRATSTIGTGGKNGMPKAAEANGDAPKVAVESVKKQADGCEQPRS